MSNKASSPQARIVIISGPSGCGKTTLHKALLASPDLKGRMAKSISATTRARRPGERQGRDYLFLSIAAFEKKIKKGEFLEWAKVFDHYYGTPKDQALRMLHRGVHVLLCIDVKGAKTVSREFPGALKIFIKAPSMKVLRDRLQNRGSESQESLATRLKVAQRELKEAGHYDHIVVNAGLGKAVRELKDIVCRELDINCSSPNRRRQGLSLTSPS